MGKTLTVRQAFKAMTFFLTNYWKKTDSDDVANLLSDMNTELWTDGSTADPAIWGEWIDSVHAVTEQEKQDALTILQAFQAMRFFLEQYIPFNTPSTAILILKNGIQTLPSGSAANPNFWEMWIQAINETQNG